MNGAAAEQTPGFSPITVFSLPDRQNIYGDCHDARSFTDSAASGVDALTPSQAIGGARALIACSQVQRLNGDPDEQRYLAVAAATALFVAATKTTGATAMKLYKSADSIDSDLGAPTPDRRTTIASTQVGMNACQHYVYKVKTDPFGGSTKLKFADIATQMRVDIANRLNDLSSPAPDTTALPQAKASGTAVPPAPATSAAPVASAKP